MRSNAFALMLVVLPLVACNSGPTLDTRTFQLKYLTVDDAWGMLQPYVYTDRPDAPGQISGNRTTLTIRETPDNLDRITRVLEEFDVPRPHVQLRFQVIEADGAARTDTAIADVEAQLRKLFRFAGYRLLATAVVGGQEGSAIEQEIPSDHDSGQTFGVNVDIQSVRVNPAPGYIQLRVAFRTSQGTVLTTSVNARNGQTVVLGNAQSAGEHSTLILTVRPEVSTP
jgi:type II secretory pathway component GspD/PulD (secretin)